MIKPKSPKDGQCQKNEGRKPQRRPKDTFDILMAKNKEGRDDHLEFQTKESDFPESGQHHYSRELIQQMISDSTTSNFRRSGSSSTRLSSVALLPGRATNVWAVGATTDDVSTLSSLGGVVRTMDATANAHPPGMVRTYRGFWPRRLLRRRQLLRVCWPPVE
jgi:hypothetical protein